MTSQLCLAGECNQCWYCNQDCQEAHAAGLSDHRVDPTDPKQAHTPHLVPHRLTCPILKRFSSIKCDPAMESVIRMLLDAMALQRLEASSNLPHNSGAMRNPYVILLCFAMLCCAAVHTLSTHCCTDEPHAGHQHISQHLQLSASCTPYLLFDLLIDLLSVRLVDLASDRCNSTLVPL